MSGEIAALLERLVAEMRAAHPERPALIGVGGAQGSGKTTACRAFAVAHPRVAHFSLDDVYNTRAQRESHADILTEISLRYGAKFHPNLTREQVAEAITRTRPLLTTRGPPGTHDLELAHITVNALHFPRKTALPRFDKRHDDRAPHEDWPIFQGPADVVLVDGWCLGATAHEEGEPLNAVEAEDALGLWRRRILSDLTTRYARFFDLFDQIVYLQAPSFEIVHRWRAQQEEEMLGRAMTEQERARLDRFIQHYERVTRHMLAGGLRADWIVGLDEDRNVLGIEQH